MGVLLVEDRLGRQKDDLRAFRRRATLEFATDLWDCRDAVLALLRAGDTDTLRQVAEAQPTETFGASTWPERKANRAAWVEAFVAGDVDEWASAGAYLFWRAYQQHTDEALLLAS